MAWVDVLSVLPVTVTGVLHVVPLLEVWMVKARVFQPVDSPPAPACLRVKLLTVCAEPRSTCIHEGETSEQNLSVVPPETLPLTALAADSLLLHAVELVVGLFSARLVKPAPTDTVCVLVWLVPALSVTVRETL